MPRRAGATTRDVHVAWPLKVIAVAAVVGAVVAAVDDLRGDDEAGSDVARPTREGSERVSGPDRSWTFGAFPSSYEVEYAVTASGSESTEVLRVVAPFDSRVENRARRTGGTGALSSERETAFGVLATRSGTAPPTVLAAPPALAGPRLGEAVLSAEPLGLVERREVRTVLGRRCQVWRTGDALGGTTFLEPDDRDYLDLCVDEAGLLLEEWQVSAGAPVRRRVAVAVDIGGVDASDVAKLPRDLTLTIDEGGGSVRRIGDDERPPGPFLVGSAPSGFTRRGRYSVVPPQAGLTEGGERGKVRASTVDVFERRADVVIVEQGGVLDLSEPWAEEGAFPDVDLGAAGTGELVPGRLGSEVRALLGSGRYLRLSGSVPLDDLVALARSMSLVDDGRGIGFSD